MSYPVDAYLRLPLFLQKAGRVEDAWQEFHRILSEGPFAGLSTSVAMMEQAKVFDKMRLFLQRIGKPDMAVAYGVCRMLGRAMGAQMQFDEERGENALRDARRTELDDFREGWQFEVSELLRKAGRSDCEDEVCELIRPVVENPLSFDPNEIISGVCRILGAQ